MQSALISFVRVVDRVNDVAGRSMAWLTLAMVPITFSVGVLRHVFAPGRARKQKSYVLRHGIVFMAGAG